MRHLLGASRNLLLEIIEFTDFHTHHFSSEKKLIDSRPRSSTLAGLPVDVSRLPPVPLSIFTGFGQKLSAPAPGNAARSARCRKSGQPLDTSRRSLDPDKICPANPTLSPSRRAPDRS